jgi:hypothetical protein
MKIGGTTRDSMMTLIPLAVAILVASILLGRPADGVRAIETGAEKVWATVVLFFRH